MGLAYHCTRLVTFSLQFKDVNATGRIATGLIFLMYEYKHFLKQKYSIPISKGDFAFNMLEIQKTSRV